MFDPVSAGLVHEMDARTLLYRTSATPMLMFMFQSIIVLEYRTESTVQKPTLDLGLFWFYGVFCIEVCPYGRRWVHLNGFLSPIRRSPPFFLKACMSDASHFNPPLPTQFCRALPNHPHAVGLIFRIELGIIRDVGLLN